MVPRQSNPCPRSQAVQDRNLHPICASPRLPSSVFKVNSPNGKVGASAVLYINNTQVAVLRYHLGKASEHTVFEAELVGMILAAHLLATIDDLPLLASVFVDNQAAILAGERSTSKPGHYLSIRFKEIIQEVHERRNLSKSDISIRRIVGHKNIRGNEEADKEAKRAATDENSSPPVDHLPLALKAKLPISTLALKQKHRERPSIQMADHLEQIQTMQPPRKNRRHGTTLSKKFLKATGFLSKSHSGVLFQLCSGHIALNKHLYRIKRSDTPMLCLKFTCFIL